MLRALPKPKLDELVLRDEVEGVNAVAGAGKGEIPELIKVNDPGALPLVPGARMLLWPVPDM